MGKDKRGSHTDNRTCPGPEVRKGSATFSECLVSVPGAQRESQGWRETQTASKPPNQASGDIGLDGQGAPLPRLSPLISPSHLSLSSFFQPLPRPLACPSPPAAGRGHHQKAARALPAVG